MFLKNALVATVSVAALASSALSVSAQTDINALYEAAKAEGQGFASAEGHGCVSCR